LGVLGTVEDGVAGELLFFVLLALAFAVVLPPAPPAEGSPDIGGFFVAVVGRVVVELLAFMFCALLDFGC
jgi:hypothetical protein